ncbi:hypothetical protein V512_009080 [Mesotoga sp. Brook.08.105.5.1]|nr:hypothetical protein V512_009080 [Mesotoga sp. Brook.08.105.5.1]
MPLQMNLAALILSWRSPVIAWSTVLFVNINPLHLIESSCKLTCGS